MNFLVKLGTYFIVLLGLAIIYGAVSGIWRGAGSENWPAVEGEITKSDIVTRNTYNGSRWTMEKFSEVLYSYEVNGVRYTHSRISFDGLYPDMGDGNARLFPLGKKVRVLYDPNDPDESVLYPDRSSAGQLFGMALMGIIFLGLGIFGILLVNGKIKPA